MDDYVRRVELRVASSLASFIENEAIPGTGLDPVVFWGEVNLIFRTFAHRNLALLEKRDVLQTTIDSWHMKRRNQHHDDGAYQEFLTEIGYLVPEPAPFLIDPPHVDREVFGVAGP